MSRELLGQVVTELYDRLGRDALLPTDFVSAGRITAPTPTSWILHAFDSGKQLHADAAVFRAFTREMGAILDIGAHWGYTALAIRQFGSSCPIVSFEPSETNAACLKILRKLDREFDFACIALGDSDEEVTLYTPVVNGVAITGLSSIDGVTLTAYGARHVVGHLGQLIPEAEFYDAKILKTKVRVRRLDDVLESRRYFFLPPFRVSVERIAGIKIDVEGFESRVLEGARRTIERNKPLIMIEGANRRPEMTRILAGFGYRFADLSDGLLVPTEKQSTAPNGYWFSPIHERRYAAMGLLQSATA